MQKFRRVALLLAAGATVLAAGCGARFPRTEGGQAIGVVDPGTGQVVDPGTGEVIDPGTGEPIPGATTGPGGVIVPGGPTGPGATTGPRGPTTGPTTPGGGQPTGGGTVDPGKRTGVTATSIKVCYLIPLTGAAPLPPQVRQGIDAYWRYLDGKGGINGRKVGAPTVYDTESNEATAKARAQDAIDDGCFVVAHLDRLGVQKSIGEYLNARQVPNIAVQTPVNLAGNQVWTFGITIDHGVQARMIAQYFKNKLKATKVAVIYETDSALKAGVAVFKSAAASMGLQVKYEKAIDGNGNDFGSEAGQLRNSQATAVWLYMAPTTMRKFVRQAEVNYHPTWFGNSISWNFNISFVGDSLGDLGGARCFSPWPALDDARTTTYKNYFRSQNGPQRPDVEDLGIPGWGLGQIISSGLFNAGKELGQNGFRNAMQNLRITRTGIVDKTPLLWSPIAFGPGLRTGASQVVTFKQAPGEPYSRWATEANYRSAY